MIYFDHSATTPIHPDVLKKMHEVNRDFLQTPQASIKPVENLDYLLKKLGLKLLMPSAQAANKYIFLVEVQKQIIMCCGKL